MQRDKWEFEYTAAKLVDAASAKREVHQAKFEWWEAKKAEVMKKVREEGIEIHDSVASSYSNVKGRFGPEIQIDEVMQRDLVECQTKILEHHHEIKNYDGWIEVLNANPEARLKLHHDDWLYFFGK